MHSADIAQAHERRRLRRFPAADLTAELRLKRTLIGGWTAAEPHDFTRTGMAVEAKDLTLEQGDLVEVRLRLALDIGELKVDKLIAVVRNIHPAGDQPRFGLEFDFQASRQMKSLTTQAQLGRIEGILDRSEKLRRRIAPSLEAAQGGGNGPT